MRPGYLSAAILYCILTSVLLVGFNVAGMFHPSKLVLVGFLCVTAGAILLKRLWSEIKIHSHGGVPLFYPKLTIAVSACTFLATVLNLINLFVFIVYLMAYWKGVRF